MSKHREPPCVIPETDEMLGWISDMYSMGPRRAGTAPDHACEDYLAHALRESGFENVRKDPIPIRVQEVESYRLAVSSSRSGAFKDVPAFNIPYTAFTHAQGVEGQLLYVDFNDPSARVLKNWKGRIIVADIRFAKMDTDQLQKFSYGLYNPGGDMKGTSRYAVWVRMHWTLYREAVKRGAAGFIGILCDHYAGGHNYYAPYGFKEKDIHDKPVPGFWVDRVQGDKIRALAKKGAGRARLFITGTLKTGVTHNVIGELPGKTSETFIIACHHDAPFSSAVEDASGCAVVLAAAKHFARTRELNRTLMVVFTAGHFYGSIGTRTFIARNQENVLQRTALQFHVEHIGLEAVETKAGLEVMNRPDFTGAFVSFNRGIKRAVWKAVVEQGLDRTMLLPAHGPLGDYPPTDGGDFHQAGIPLVNTISPPVYLLNEEDTLDKVAVGRLQPMARFVVSVLRQLDAVPFKQLRRTDYPARAALMRILSRIVHLRARSMGIY